MRMWLGILLMPFVAQANEMVLVKGGNYVPLFAKGEPATVSSFWIDETAVRNQDFSGFVKKIQIGKKAKHQFCLRIQIISNTGHLRLM